MDDDRQTAMGLLTELRGILAALHQDITHRLDLLYLQRSLEPRVYGRRVTMGSPEVTVRLEYPDLIGVFVQNATNESITATDPNDGITSPSIAAGGSLYWPSPGIQQLVLTASVTPSSGQVTIRAFNRAALPGASAIMS